MAKKEDNMITIGADVHLKTTTFSVMEKYQRIKKKKVNNSSGEILEFVRQFEGPKRYSMETSYNWPVFYELLKDEVGEFNLLHAKKLKSIIESQGKTDGKDADELAYLTEIGYLPRAHIAKIETRANRNLLRLYLRVSSSIAAMKNRIHAIINANVFYYERPGTFKDIFCERGKRYLREVELPKTYRYMVDELMQQIEFMQGVKGRLLKKIEELHVENEDLTILRTAPGMGGKVLSYVVMSEVDNVLRFRNARAAIAYAGLVPKERSSGEKIRRGRLRTECNWFLKWALIEAVTGAIFKDRNLRKIYKEAKVRTNTSSAKVKIARILMRTIYHMLKEKVKYDTNKVMGNSVAPIAGK